MAAPPRKLRVLCLHGLRTNSKVMADQIKGLRAALPEDVAEYVYIDAPHLARGPSDPVIEERYAKHAPFYEWWDVESADVDFESEDTAHWIFKFVHHEETLEFMAEQLKKLGPFDIAVGFSQGGVLLTLLSMIHLQNHGERLWKLCIFAGGIPVQGVNVRHIFQSPEGRKLLVPIPSIHLVGKLDPFYADGHMLAEMYDNTRTVFPASPLKRMVIDHEGGHQFPPTRKHQALYEELARIVVDHCRACDKEEGATAGARL